MFEAGSILFFDPFYFENGNNPKPKYFLVIKELDGQVILASLPTSRDSVPATIEKIHGCIEHPEINFNCYYFKAGKLVASDQEDDVHFAFPKDTYVYGFRIALFDVDIFNRQMAMEKTNVTIKGYLYDDEYRALIDCLKKSTAVKKKVQESFIA